MSKHTPGPWVRSSQGFNVLQVGENGQSVCSLFNSNFAYSISDEERIANASLIAAAPDLLSEAEDVRRVIAAKLSNMQHRSTGRDPKHSGYAYIELPDWQARQLLDALDAAIAKATAQPPA